MNRWFKRVRESIVSTAGIEKEIRGVGVALEKEAKTARENLEEKVITTGNQIVSYGKFIAIGVSIIAISTVVIAVKAITK